MKTFEILFEGDVLRRKFNSTDEAMEWGKVLGATSLIRVTPNGKPVGNRIYNPQTGGFKKRLI